MDDKGKPIILLTFRNASCALLFQGQLMKNVTKFCKHKGAKTFKVQRSITVVGKKSDGNVGTIKCIITVFLLIK